MKQVTRTIIFFAITSIVLSSCMAPKSLYDSYSAPDYANGKIWAALPTTHDKADVVPSQFDLSDKQDYAKVDVFFVHYTTYWVTPFKRNAKLNNMFANNATKGSIKRQASVFNGSCKVYVPRYRQASAISYLDIEGKGKKAFDLAYQDVKAAFKYFLKKHSKGRPFIIAAHSQGSMHAQRLIQELIETDSALHQRMIVAYLPGWANQMENKLAVPCDSANQLGCVNSWQTVRRGTVRKDKFPNKIIFRPSNSSINPLTWTRTSDEIGLELNKGGAPLFMKTIQPNVCDAQIENDLLWIRKPQQSGYIGGVFHYHLSDYSLFYMNIRENIGLRIAAYFKK